MQFEIYPSPPHPHPTHTHTHTHTHKEKKTTRQPWWVILCRLPEKERKEIEEIVKEMKEGNREERGIGMKVKKQKK